MKKALAWIVGILLSPILLFILLTLLLYLPPVQNWAVDKAAEIASEETGLQISVGTVSLSFPLDLELQEVKVLGNTPPDQGTPADNGTQEQATEVAYIERAVVDMRLLPLLKKHVEVDELALSGMRMNTLDLISDVQVQGRVGRLALSAHHIDLGEGTVQLNDAQIADADVCILLSDTAAVDTTTSEPVPWLIRMDSLNITRSRLELHTPGDSMLVTAYMGHARAADAVIDLLGERYTLKDLDWTDGQLSYDRPFEPRTPQGMDYSHLSLSDISLGIDSVFFASPSLALSISHAALKEHSGLELTQLKGKLLMDSTTFHLPRLTLSTPYSKIRAHMDMDFSLMDEKNPGRLQADVDASVGRHDLLLFTAGALPDGGRQWPDWPLNVHARMAGNMEHADIGELSVTLPTAFHAETKGTVGHVTDLKTLLAQLDVEVQTYDAAPLLAMAGVPQSSFRLPPGLTLKGGVKANGPRYTADLLLRDGRGTVRLKGQMNQEAESYDADIDIDQLNLRRFVPNDSLGLLTATVTARGKGFDVKQHTTWAEADAHIAHFGYGRLNIDSVNAFVRQRDGHGLASVRGHNHLLDGEIDVDALIGHNNGAATVRATIATNLKRLNLYELGLTEKPLSVGGCSHIDMAFSQTENGERRTERSDNTSYIEVNGLIGDLFIADSVNTYRPQDVGLLLRTNADTTLVRLQSGNLIMKLDASGYYEDLLGSLSVMADSINAQLKERVIDQPAIMRLLPNMRLYVSSGQDNPIADFLRTNNAIKFKEVLVNLTTSPTNGINGQSHILALNADSTRIDTIRLNLVHKEKGLTFNGLVANNKKNPQFVFRTLFDGQLQEHGANVGIRFFDERNKLGLRLGAKASMMEDGIGLHFIPARPTIGYKEFNLNDDNYLLLSRSSKIEAKIDLIADDGTGVKIYSSDSLSNENYLQDLTVSLYRFDLDKLTQAIPYVPRITGELNGDYHVVMDQKKQISVASDMSVKQMTYEQCPIGNVSTEFVYLQREDDTHAVEGRLMLDEKEVGLIKGDYRHEGSGYLHAAMKLTRFPLGLVNGFVPQQLIGLEGFADGDMSVDGPLNRPDVDGEVMLDEAALLSVPYGVRLRFDNDPVRVMDSKLLLENFTMYAYNNEPLNIMGDIDFHNTDRITMDIRMRAQNFQLVNAKQTKESIAYGKAFVNFFARMNGPLDQLRMRGRLDVLGTTDLTYILLDSPLSTDNRMEELVKFTDFTDSTLAVVTKPTPEGLDVDMTVSIDDGTHVMCALNVDQTNYVDLFGGGNLHMKYSNEGISMTGRYTMSSGEMKYSLPIIPLKTFTIEEGSYVEFTGDPADPRLHLTAVEHTKAAVGGEGEQSRSVAFDCGVFITKTLNDMGLEFVIKAPEDMSIQNELNAMSTEQRGKLAVTMLTTGMYLADGNTKGFSMNSALSSFLQSEINNITGSALKTLDLSVGLDNTTDATGQMHTDYSFKFAKRFWNNRLKVQIGCKVSTGNEVQTGQNQSFFDNVTMEYRLRQNSNQYVKLFYNQNVYDWLEGYTGEYGVGFIWKRQMNSLLDLFRKTPSNNMPGRSGSRFATPGDSTRTRGKTPNDSIKTNGHDDTK